MDNKIKIIQQNLRKSPTAHNELRSSIVNFNPDIIALQEPYVVNNRPPFPIVSRIFQVSDNSIIYCPIVVLNNSLIVNQIDNFTNYFATAIKIQTNSSLIILVNIYLHSNSFSEVHFNYFSDLFASFDDYPIIIVGDFNARNTYWNDTIINKNGYKFKEIIDLYNLIVINNKSKTLPTIQYN